ncbi:hypothetical protein [Sodalis sp. RH20]|uniref:hypothetical protein n=1 Tax=unclassified Sodalis (in: enterobacteria) TaxID=2636512 RepID=UPI0039B50481
MAECRSEQLIFRPASEKPTEDMHDVEVIVYNPCDGWHIGEIRVDKDDDCYIGIYDWSGSELTSHDFYVTWAILPDGLKLGRAFEVKKGWTQR